MQCKHVHTISGKEVPCNLQTIVDDLPLDESGLCIFHSQDREWKIKEKAFSYLNTLFDIIHREKHQTFGFHGFYFTGKKEEEEYMTRESVIHLNRVLFKSNLTFYDCHFLDEVDIEDSSFKESLTFVKCTFEEEIAFNGCRFFEEVSFYDHCVFKQKLSFTNFNVFYSKAEFVNSSFAEDLDIDGAHMAGSLYIDLCEFSKDYGLYLFNSDFKKGISVRNNTGIGLFSLEENKFQEDSLIHNINNDGSITFINNELYGELKFQGTSDNLLFNPNTQFEMGIDNFQSEKARLIFDYCNILSLNNDFLRKLSEWEESEKVMLNDTNKLTRFKAVHTVSISDISEDLLRDIMTLVMRYFNHRYNLELDVSFRRMITQRKVKVIFSSKQKIDFDDFYEDYVQSVNDIFNQKKYNAGVMTPSGSYSDLVEQIYAINRRVGMGLLNGSFNKKQLKRELEFKEDNIAIQVTINNLMGDQYNINDSNVGAVGAGASSHNNTFQNLNVGYTDNQFKDIAEQLKTLQEKVSEDASTIEEKQTAQLLLEAQSAAENKDTKGLLSKLKPAGKLALDTAKELGVSLAAEVIKTAMQG